MNAPWTLTTVTQMLCALTPQAALHVHATLASQEMESVVWVRKYILYYYSQNSIYTCRRGSSDIPKNTMDLRFFRKFLLVMHKCATLDLLLVFATY